MTASIVKLLTAAISLSLLVNAAPHNNRGKGKGPGRPGQGQGQIGGGAKSQRATGRAIYFMTNDAQNAVVALPIAADGTVSAGTITPTGGRGGNSIDGSKNVPAAPDALVSQSALTVVGQNIFVANAGDNTVSMLTISTRDPTKLTMVGKPAAIPGEFPNTVAASAKHRMVCVGTTGAKSGISCSNFDNAAGIGKMDGLRPFDLGQKTPPVGPTNTVSQTFFSEDESKLFTTVKGDPPNNKTGFFSSFPVEAGCGANGKLSTQETRSSPDGTVVLFGSANIPGTSRVFATDAAFGAAILDVTASNGKASLLSKQAIDGQKATCWVAISPATGSAFVTDVAANRVVEMSTKDASILGMVDLSANGDPGLIDLRAAGNFVYALSPGNGATEAAVTVLDVSGGKGSAKMKQHFQMGKLGVSKNAQGMAILV